MIDLSEEDVKKYAQMAAEAMSKAYAPYSKHTVGAVVVDENNVPHVGCNVENSVYPTCVCAEVNAITTMVYSGAREIKAVFVVGPSEENLVTPCGNCRQTIREFTSGDALIYSVWKDGRIGRVQSLNELLPDSFGPDHLK
tara:strand:- start:210 stop:629 length:420 start_codon:yes stop_codon:yes gene_type:complete